MKNPNLKIKIMSLAAEARIIRHQERKALVKGRRIAETHPESAAGLRKRARNWHLHRTLAVRREARHAQLAQAFFAETPYERVERPRKGNEPDWPAVFKMVARFGGDGAKLQAWTEAEESQVVQTA